MKSFIRNCVKNLDAYKVEAPHYDIILNANENPWDFPANLKKELCDQIMKTPLNRYPEACFPELLKALADYTGAKEEQIICGSGSDELIALINQAFVNPAESIVTHTPSFAMYQIWTAIADADFIGIPDKEGHIPNVDSIIADAKEYDAKLIYLCNPNNPTGYLFPRYDVIQILEETNALVILDEAYMEFKGSTYADLIDTYPNLLVLRTLSKAFGLAGIRCGYCLGNKKLIDALYKVKSPYNLNTITQMAAVIALNHRDELLAHLEVLNTERRKMYHALQDFQLDKLYPTAANFIYFETKKSEALYKALKKNAILVKYFAGHSDAPAGIRLSIGTPKENKRVLAILKEVL
ncbi:MAG: histidinol-phosphate transaminase [Eubacterium sp.]